ncbi:MAG: BamA/TamA family outer membrane protein, partial [Candidatus Kapabacteria bacterium]|nr:BamA/TamA family outer membrane protein [Candidatus Kapabacteria bacterium]
MDLSVGILHTVTQQSKVLSYLLRLILVTALYLCGAPYLLAQDEYEDSVARAGERSRVLQLDELQAVVFVGCVETTPEQLIGVISSLPSELSITRKLTLYYEENFRLNPATPTVVLERLAKIRKDLEAELRYYDPVTAKADSLSILTYLDQNGFHFATVNTAFGYNASTRKNTLTFTINEGQQAHLDTIIITGLEEVDSNTHALALQAQTIKIGDPFVEANIERSIRSMVTVLQNNGHYQALYQPPIVGISADGMHDTLVVIIKPGRRVRIDTIVLEEFRGGYPSVNETTRRRQLDIEPGEWYDRQAIEQSRANLMSLGTFELVLIDTIADDSVTGKSYRSDSTISIRFTTRNSKPYDVGMSLLCYQTAVDNYLNVGVGATAQYRNVFGGAQVASVTLQYVLEDVSRLAQGQELQTEALASVVFAWPNIGRIFEKRFGLQTSTFYSLRQLVNPFRLESMGFSARLPISLFTYTFFNNLDVTAGIERQIPHNFNGALDNALKEARTPEEVAYVLSTFNQFLVLDKYLTRTGNLYTGINVGLTLHGDLRNNPINATRGTYSSLSVEYGVGAGNYIRSQAFLSAVFPLSSRLVAATKIKLGHIFLLQFTRGDSTRDNTYVPLERQFFAGGPASIRSFPSRMLHDPHSGRITEPDAEQQYILANVVGSGSLAELGFELRYTFAKPRGGNEIWSSIVERSGFTFFTDVGNSF